MNNYGNFKTRVLKHLIEYKKKYISNDDGEYGSSGKTYGHILLKEHFKNNFLPDVVIPEDIRFHTYSLHLNSSQVMCINFFMPLLKEKKLFFDLLNSTLPVKIKEDDEIRIWEFEHAPHGKLRTNFDFYLELSSGLKFYFEIKYTENAFGKTGNVRKYPGRYEKEWDRFYKRQCTDSLYLKDISYSDFFADYQLNRNIAYVKEKNDHVIFLYPFDNMNLHSSYNKMNYENVYAINWHEIIKVTLSLVEKTSLYDHYRIFGEKYLNY